VYKSTWHTLYAYHLIKKMTNFLNLSNHLPRVLAIHTQSAFVFPDCFILAR